MFVVFSREYQKEWRYEFVCDTRDLPGVIMRITDKHSIAPHELHIWYVKTDEVDALGEILRQVRTP